MKKEIDHSRKKIKKITADYSNSDIWQLEFWDDN